MFKEWLTDGGRRDTPQDRSLRGIDGWNPEPPHARVPREEVQAEFEKYRQRAALAVESGDWDQWADQFTDDAHYREHHYGYFTLRRRDPGLDQVGDAAVPDHGVPAVVRAHRRQPRAAR